MPIRGKGQRLPVPTEAQYREQLSEGHEVVACSGTRFEQQSALSIACHNGDIATLVVDEHVAGYLVGVLRYLFPECESSHAVRAWDGGATAKAQAGFLST